MPTEAGERLLSYARRLLSLAEEARDVVSRAESEGAVSLGVPEDFAAYRLAKLLATFSRSYPGIRLDVTAKDGFAPIDRTEVALVASPDASPLTSP